MGLDLLRVLEQDPAAVEGVLDALGQAASGERRLETALRELRELLADPADLERRARHFVETLARAPAAALVLEHAQIGRAHVRTQVTTAHLVCRLVLET